MMIKVSSFRVVSPSSSLERYATTTVRKRCSGRLPVMMMTTTTKSWDILNARQPPLRKRTFDIRCKFPRVQHSSLLLTTRTSTILLGSTNDRDMKTIVEGPTTLAPETIAEMIEVSFIQSCLQLSQGYIDVLKLFIVAVKAGHEHPLPLHEVHNLVTNCSVNSAGRELMKEEKELRYEWMKVVYQLLNALNPNSSNADHDGAIHYASSAAADDDEQPTNEIEMNNAAANTRITGVIQSMISIQRKFLDEQSKSGGLVDAILRMTNLTVDQAIAQSNSLSKLYESTLHNPMERAILTNDIRVAILTFRVLEEERVCTMQDEMTNGGNDDVGMEERVPRPSIPGT